MKDVDPSQTPPPNPPDQRRSLRVPIRILRIETDLPGDIFFGHATNISQTGLFIKTENPKPPGYQAHIRFYLPKSDYLISALGEVVWIQEYTGKSSVTPGMGIRFAQIVDESTAKIREFVEQEIEG